MPRVTPYHTYRALDAVNWSTLKHMRKSPKHYRYMLDNPQKDSTALAIGRAVHVAVLEPEKLDSMYYVYPGDRRGKKWEAFRDAHTDREILREKEWDEIRTAAAAVRSDPVAAEFLTGEYVEQAFTWNDAETGIKCKCRVDAVAGGLVELKTTASLRWFPSDFVKFGYDCQIAYYVDALIANGVPALPPTVIAVEKSDEHDVVVYRITDAQVDAGRRKYRELLRLLQECREADHWPGVAGGSEMELVTPAWAASEDEKVTLGGVEI